MGCGRPLLLPLLFLIVDSLHAADRPNIIIILADDLGWNDISFHGSDQFQTPNIDALAYSGVILRDYYSQPICTPARAALLTGRHPIHNGMQHDVIYAPQPWGVPLTERFMPQYLKTHGYVTRAIGKWHLGFFKKEYTPTFRGFDSFFGTWLGHGNHFTHKAFEKHPGYDLHRNMSVAWEGKGRYDADLFTEEAESLIQAHDTRRPLFMYLAHTQPHSPLQAPETTVNSFYHIPQDNRRTYAAMVSKVDESVGRVVRALRDRDMLNNSIILFLSDNGGATNGFNGNVASNWPLRGCKDTLWEGGVRSVGLVWSPLLRGAPRVHHGLVNVQDWLPTLLSAIGTEYAQELSRLDGMSQWRALNNQSGAPYTHMLHNIDVQRRIGAVRMGKWKLIIGRTRGGYYDSWFGQLTSFLPYNLDRIRHSEAGRALKTTPSPLPTDDVMRSLRRQATVTCQPVSKHLRYLQISSSRIRRQRLKQLQIKDKNLIITTSCNPRRAPCLFNIEEDPCEMHNVAVSHPDIVQQLMRQMERYQPVRPNNRRADYRSLPEWHGHVWTPWWSTRH